jgi:hypothetical protein
MRRFLAWLACAGGAAFVLSRRLRRRHAAEAAVDPAEELKRKLEESRTAETPPAPEAPGSSLEERRRVVHDRARAAIDEMRGGEDVQES